MGCQRACAISEQIEDSASRYLFISSGDVGFELAGPYFMHHHVARRLVPMMRLAEDCGLVGLAEGVINAPS
jgi:hypothetical protein